MRKPTMLNHVLFVLVMAGAVGIAYLALKALGA